MSLLTISTESGAKKVGESVSSRALDAVVDYVKSRYGETQVLLGTTFLRYLENATLRYNQIRTLATGPTPKKIIGEGNIYINIGVKYRGNELATSTVDEMLTVSRNILIVGTGGIGKSMLMRYLFLNTANRGEYVPVLLELRKISNLPPSQISILELIYSCMEDFDIQLQKEQFEYSLRLGKYLFLMDGLDEVKECQAREVAEGIQKFCSKYPNNICIVTSRRKQNISLLETFTRVQSMPLSKKQAVTLASKIWDKDEKTVEFCRQLEENLYDDHRDFAENPLLLSMMFLTFMRNNSIPNYLAEFYSKAYDALYCTHDTHDKGYYLREFKCQNLDEASFKRILSHFCFQTYFKEKYEFTKDEVLSHLQQSILKSRVNGIRAIDYLADLRNVVCLLVEDGNVYRFSHRSFQTYFAALYTSSELTDQQQNKLFNSVSFIKKFCIERSTYGVLLVQIEPHRFVINAIEKRIRELQMLVDEQDCPNIFLLKAIYNQVILTDEIIIET